MKLLDYLKNETICVNLKSHKKDEVISELAESLRNHSAMGDFDEFLRAVSAREMDSTTGIGDGVGIPHARTDSVNDFVAAVGISSGIDFKAIDGKPVKLVILMGVPAHRIKSYLQLLAHLSVLLKQQGFIKRLTEAPDAETVMKTFAEYEE